MLRWLLQLADFFALLLAWMMGRKYVPRSARGEAGHLSPRRFIMIQIDGLAQEYLLQAIARAQMPGLQRLIVGGHRLQRWRCGVPSSTPATQAGLMYGSNWDIPAFRWYEKDTGIAPHCKSPYFAQRIKARASAGKRGILSGGSSYTNLLDGDARLALFTLSSMNSQRFFEHLRGLGWALLFAVIPWRILRIIVMMTWELIRDIGRTLWQWGGSRFRRPLHLVKPLLQVLTNVVFGEVQTFGVMLDVYRGMPAIYVNFYGYDEVAHSDGPAGREALRALRRIDGYIRQIERIRHTYRPETDLYIFSDHGMTPAIPFQRLDAKKSLGQIVAHNTRASVLWDQSPRDNTWQNIGADTPGAGFEWLLDELDGIEPHLSRRARRLAGALRRRLRERLAPTEGSTQPDPDSEYDLARSSDVVVRASGSLAHIYFNVSREPMEVSEIAILYPDLVDELNSHPGIGLVLGRERGRAVIVTSRGTVGLSADRLPPGLPEPARTADDLARLLRFPHSGDLVLLGAWTTLGRVVTFEDQVATHGGIGGPQDYPFFLTPVGSTLDLSCVTNAEQLYPYFIQTYHAGAPPEAPRDPCHEKKLMMTETER